MRGIPDQLAYRGPALLTVAALVLVTGYGLGVFAAVGARPAPTIQDATISGNGATCSIQLFNADGTDGHLSLIIVSYNTPLGFAWADSFPSDTTVRAHQLTAYTCALGTPTQLLPTVSGTQGAPYNITARFEDGTVISYSSRFV